MSNEYKDWENDELADLHYCLHHMYDILSVTYNKLYEDYEEPHDDIMRNINNVLTNVDDTYQKDNISCLASLVFQEYKLLLKLSKDNRLNKYNLKDTIDDIIKNVEYLRGDTLEGY